MRQSMIVVGNTLVHLYVSVGSGRRRDGEGVGEVRDDERGCEERIRGWRTLALPLHYEQRGRRRG